MDVNLTPPSCENHVERQHRDGMPPWCDACGWNRGTPSLKPIRVRARGTVPDGEMTPRIL